VCKAIFDAVRTADLERRLVQPNPVVFRADRNGARRASSRLVRALSLRVAAYRRRPRARRSSRTGARPGSLSWRPRRRGRRSQ
jgi:hypothetical protein